jgi:hypothetical protein
MSPIAQLFFDSSSLDDLNIEELLGNCGDARRERARG